MASPRTLHLSKLSVALTGLFSLSAAWAASDTAPVSVVAATGEQKLTTIEVIATHMKSERIELSPKVGTTVYTVDTHMIDNLGQGADTSFDQVLLRLPGVSQDSKASGSMHVRDEHGNVQYRINGVQLPEGITGFG